MKRKFFILPYNEKRRLHARACRAQQKDQSEVCGIMSADRHLRIELHFVKNNSDKAGSFSKSIADLTDVRKKVKQNRQFIGVFHSHVVSEAVPGSRDIQNARVSHLQLIYDVCGHDAKLWRIKKVKRRKVAVEVPLIVASRKSQLVSPRRTLRGV
jgi:proteasome lid subunit RPN8/RPN11